jgi:hypothetical protein
VGGRSQRVGRETRLSLHGCVELSPASLRWISLTSTCMGGAQIPVKRREQFVEEQHIGPCHEIATRCCRPSEDWRGLRSSKSGELDELDALETAS